MHCGRAAGVSDHPQAPLRGPRCPSPCPLGPGVVWASLPDAQPHTWAQAHEQKVECSSNSHVSRLGVSSAWAGFPGGPVVVVGVWGRVEGGG